MSQDPQPSGPPAIPTSSSKLGIVLLVVVALVGVGAAVWLFGPKSQAVQPVATPASAEPTAVTTFRRTDDLPPPPEELPVAPADAGVADAGAAKGSRSSALASGCDVPACGSSAIPVSLQSALALKGRNARSCYERELANDPTLSVKMNLRVRVGTNGNVCSTSVTDSSNAAVATCVQNQFRSAGFPAAKGCVADVVVPLSYVPR